MNFLGHSTGGIMSSGISGAFTYSQTNSFKMACGCAVTTYIFSLYPDMDIRSTSRKLLTIAGLLGTLVLFWANPVYSLILISLTLAPRMFPHRGFNHSLLMMLIVSLTWNVMFPGTIWAVVIGFMTHLILDTHIHLT